MRSISIWGISRRSDFEKPVLAVELCGGLGNQLFQFCNALNLAIINGLDLKLEFNDPLRSWAIGFVGVKPGCEYSFNLDLECGITLKEKSKTSLTYNPISIKENSFTFKSIGRISSHARIVGYYQSPKYFKENEKSILRFIQDRLERINPIIREEVVAHVRLGDMARNKTSYKYHGIVSQEYLISAYHNLGTDKPLIIVSESISDLKLYYPKFYGMAEEVHCKSQMEDFNRLRSSNNLVISNSTFSWWAGYLSKAKVIAPSKWFADDVQKKNPINDLIPPQWELL